MRKKEVKRWLREVLEVVKPVCLSPSWSLTSGQVTQTFWTGGFSSLQREGSLPERWQNACSRHHYLWDPPEWTKSETKGKKPTPSHPTDLKTTHSFIHTSSTPQIFTECLWGASTVLNARSSRWEGNWAQRKKSSKVWHLFPLIRNRYRFRNATRSVLFLRAVR